MFTVLRCVLLDQVIAPGAVSVRGASVFGGGGADEAATVPGVVVYHAGFGAGGSITIEGSIDGVNWRSWQAIVISEAVPTMKPQGGATDAGFKYYRAFVTNGGANGGRLFAVLLVPRNVRHSP